MKATLMSFMLFIESHPVSCMPIAHAHVLTAPCTMHFSFAWHENDALENQLIFLRLSNLFCDPLHYYVLDKRPKA